MSWLTSWLRSDGAAWILKTGQAILSFIFRKAKDAQALKGLQDTAWKVVKHVEDAAKMSGTIKDKYQMAYEMIKKEYPAAREGAINLAIEVAHAALEELQASQG